MMAHERSSKRRFAGPASQPTNQQVGGCVAICIKFCSAELSGNTSSSSSTLLIPVQDCCSTRKAVEFPSASSFAMVAVSDGRHEQKMNFSQPAYNWNERFVFTPSRMKFGLYFSIQTALTWVNCATHTRSSLRKRLAVASIIGRLYTAIVTLFES